MKYFLYTFLLGILLTGFTFAHAETGTQATPIGTTLSIPGDAFTPENIRAEASFRSTCTSGGGLVVTTGENAYSCQATPTPTPVPTTQPTPTPPGDAAGGLDAAGRGVGTAPSKITCVDTSTGGSEQIDGTTCPPGTQAATNIKPSSFTAGGGGGAPSDQTSLQNYVPLEPLPFMATYAQFNFSGFLTTLFKVLISAAGLIAVGALVVGGITYMVSEVTHRKVQALERVRSALWGLLILVASVLILNTVNPQLTSFNNILNPVSTPGSSVPTQQNPTTQPAPNIVGRADQAYQDTIKQITNVSGAMNSCVSSNEKNEVAQGACPSTPPSGGYRVPGVSTVFPNCITIQDSAHPPVACYSMEPMNF